MYRTLWSEEHPRFDDAKIRPSVHAAALIAATEELADKAPGHPAHENAKNALQHWHRSQDELFANTSNLAARSAELGATRVHRIIDRYLYIGELKSLGGAIYCLGWRQFFQCKSTIDNRFDVVFKHHENPIDQVGAVCGARPGSIRKMRALSCGSASLERFGARLAIPENLLNPVIRPELHDDGLRCVSSRECTDDWIIPQIEISAAFKEYPMTLDRYADGDWTLFFD